MAEKLRFGIMSTGNIARQFAAGVRDSQRCVLQAVGSRTLDAAKVFAAAQQMPAAYGSYAELIADPKVDAIYIGLPNSMHHAWAIKALRAGKHVLCEKPMATDERQAREMFDVARECKRVLAEAFMYRSHPQTLTVLETIRSGVIGEVRLIRTSFNYKTTKIADNIRFNAELAGGSLMDIGCYCIDFSQLVAGAHPTKVTAVARMHESDVDELAAGVMLFPSGILATFTCGMTVPASNTACICGTDGYIEIPVPWKPPMHAGQFTIAHGITPKMDGAKAGQQTGPQVINVDNDRDLYGYEADDFAAAALDHAAPRMPEEATLSNMRILDDLRRQVGVRS